MKKITFLFALLCASMMGFAQAPVTGSSTENMAGQGNPFTNGYDYSFSSEGTNVTISFTEKEGYTGLVAYLWNYTNGFAETGMTVSGSTATITLTGQTPGATIRFACKFAYAGGMSVTKEFTYTIPEGGEGGEEPDPTPEPEPEPEPEPGTYTANGHTIHLDAYYIANGESNDYTLVITSEEAMNGLGGSFWFVNGVSTDIRNDMTISDDKKTIICKATSTTNPTIHTPLYMMMPGEVNFGNITLDWVDRTPIASEYCNYQGPETLGGGKYITLSWETDADGNVVITMGNGTGASSCSFRNGGFEGGINAFVVSTDDFVTTTPASNYFTSVGVYSGNTYTLTKIADVPAGAKIKHIGGGSALAWKVDDANPYTRPEFIYTYGGICNQLDAPTNVAVSADSVITFDAVAGATRYTAYVYLGGIEKYKQEVASGDVLHFWPYVDGDYIVNLIASGEGKTDSDPSADFTWTLAAREVVLGASEYCEKIMSSGNTEAAFTWETTDEGAIIITITESLGGAADAAHFRGNGMAIGNFKIGSSKSNASDYFNHACDEGNQVILTLKDPAIAPVKGEKIYFKNTVEYTTSQNDNAWPTLEFEYTYGTVCVGKTVSANVNNAAMGTAVVKKGDEVVSSVEAGTEVTFIATIADAEKYRFVNWTKAGIEVSTDLSYTTTITETTNLVANFEYILYTFCHYPVEATGGTANGKKIFITLGKNASGKYQILFEGSAEAPLLALNNANYIVNHVSTDIAVEGVNGSGNDVPFSSANGRWSFDAAGLGSAKMEFTLEEGRTISDIFVWTRYIAFAVDGGDLIYNSDEIFNQLRYNIDWNATCADEEAPVITTTKAEVQNESTVLLTLTATDNWQGMLTYTIAREGAEDITLQAVSGEVVAQEITGLTAGTEYTFNITVSDGKFTTNTSLTATPLADEEKPVMVSATLESKTWDNAVIAVEATDNKAVVAYRLVDATNSIDAEFVAVEGKINLVELTEATDYSFTITAKDAAGNESENSVVVSFTTQTLGIDLALNKEVEASGYDNVNNLFPEFAVDNDEGTLWSARTGETGAERVYDAWILVDLGGFYDINMISIRWEGACSRAYHVDFSANKIDWRVAYNAGWDAIATHWETLTGTETDNTKVRYVRVWSTEAVSQWGIKIMALRVYGVPWVPEGDNEKPAMGAASLASKTYNSAIINVAATDNTEIKGYRVVDTTNGVDAEFTAKDGKITITGLTPSTTYNFTITAIDAASNESENSANISVVTDSYSATPLTAAPVPTWPADQVKSLYSNSYPFAPAGLNSYNEGWWNAPAMTEGNVDGNTYLYYTLANDGMIGWQYAETSVASMENLHIDIWASASGTISIRPITIGGPETRKSLTLVAQQWNSFDIPLSEFGAHDYTKLFQFAIEYWNAGGLTGEFIGVDNVYFYRTTPIVDDVVPTNLTVSVNKESFYSIALDVQAEDNMPAVFFSIKNGETEVATGAAASGATTTITVNNLTPNTNYTFTVIAKDEAGNESAPESVTAKTLAVPAPAPAPTYPADLVKSLYSNAYTPAATLGNTNENWWQAPTNSEVNLGEGDMALLYENIPATSSFGWAFSTFDAIGYQTLHMSIYPLNNGTIEIYPVIQPEGEFHRTSQTLVANQWNDVVIDFSDKTFTTFTQFGFTNFSALGAFFIDNVYFYKAPEAVNFADDATDNSTIVANNADKFANVTINRSILANGEWFTLCLPFDMDEDKVFEVFGNSTIATLVSSEDRGSLIHLNFDYVKTIEAGKAYMIKPGKDFVAGSIIEGVTIKNVNPEDLKSTCEHMYFQGVFDQYLLEGDNKRFVGANNYLYSPAEGGTTMGAFRCYFTIPVESQALVGSKAARIVFGPQVATGTENVQSDQVPSAKVIIDGTLYIIRDGRTYNAQGQLVK